MAASKKKLIRITTVPLSLEKLLEGQLAFMDQYYDVIAVSSDKERLKNYGETEGVSVHHIELTRQITLFKDLIAVYRTYNFLKKEKPLIVHTHTPKAGIVGMMAAFIARVPLRLHTVAGLPLMEASGFKRQILNTVEKLTYYFATNVYPNSKGLYDFITSERFTVPSKLKIIGQGSSNGIDTSYFNPENYDEYERLKLRKELNIPLEDFTFIFVGRIVADKGINELIEVFEKLSIEHLNISLILVGPFEEELDPLDVTTIRKIEESPKIFSLGYQVDVRPLFAISDCLAFPSYREGFPNVVMQAGAMNLPSIVTNINGCNEIITKNMNGLIIPVKDVTALYEAMKRILLEKELFEKMKSVARQNICAKYERRKVCEAILEEYRQLEAKL